MHGLTRTFGTILLSGAASVVVVNAQKPPEARRLVYVIPVREGSKISGQIDKVQRREETRTLERNLEWARQAQLRNYEQLEIPERPATPILIKVPVLRREAPRTQMELVRITATNRIEAAQKIFDLEIWAINRVVEQLQDDLAKLQRPYYWESEYEKQRKLEVIRTCERTLTRLEQQAREEANTGTNVVRNSSGTIELKTGSALGQLRNIQINGWPR